MTNGTSVIDDARALAPRVRCVGGLPKAVAIDALLVQYEDDTTLTFVSSDAL